MCLITKRDNKVKVPSGISWLYGVAGGGISILIIPRFCTLYTISAE